MSRSKNTKPNKFTNKSKKSSSKDVKPSNPGLTPDTRKDNMDSGKSGYPNDPNWYYGDAILGDELSRFSFNQFVGISDERLVYDDSLDLPSVMVIPLNPCPGVTPANRGSYRVPEVNSVNGVNQALQQWWTVLTSRSGRGAQYSKVDVGMLILSLGEIISTIEHLRRFFGIAFTYNLRNRVIPGGLIQAMGIDEYDFLGQLADYRLRLNTLIMRLNKIPIPGNIEYFRKCQDLYQKIYVDSISDMAQTYVMVPATTWIINEQLSPTGTVLETKPAFFSIQVTPSPGDEEKLYYTPRYFGDYLDQLENMIAALMNSSTFSNIYSDMLNAASMGNISLWSFDLIPEQYSVVPEYNEMMLLMIHNLVPTGIMDVPRQSMLSHIGAGTDFLTRYDWGTPLNDVFSDPDEDIIVYNPNFLSWATDDTQKRGTTPLLFDMLSPNPDAGTRIEVGVYKYGTFDANGYLSLHSNANIGSNVQAFDLCLPDHYAVTIFIYCDVDCRYDTSDSLAIPGVHLKPVGGPANGLADTSKLGYALSKFQWAPITFASGYTDDNGATIPRSPYGELNYYTILNNDWIVHVTDAKYFGLFQIK